MAQKSTKSTASSRAPAITAVRNTAIPKSQPQQQQRQVTREMIAKRAYEIFKSGKGGSEQENWLRAERELRG
jgi:hypothetical protein